MKDKKYTLTVSLLWNSEKGKQDLGVSRINDGFNAYEVLGILAEAQDDILNQMKGHIKPDVVTRQVIVDKEMN